MKLFKEQFYISAICDRTVELSKNNNYGIEITEFSYAENMDRYFDETIKKINEYFDTTKNLIFHAPFYEMSMAAIDSKADEITKYRFNQFYNLASKFNPKKLVFHTGFLPNVYYKEWFLDNSIKFLKQFIEDKNITICIENVFSDTPDLIYNILSNVNNEKLKLCLDIGHINAYAKKEDDNNIVIKKWIDKLYKYIDHLHIHNNYGNIDNHNDVYDGNINIEEVIKHILSKNINPTYTVEVSKIKDFDVFINNLCEKKL